MLNSRSAGKQSAWCPRDPSLSPPALLDEFIDGRQIIPACLEPFRAGSRNLAAARLQGRLNRSLESAALVCLDLYEKDGFIGRAGRDLSSDPLHRVRLRDSNL